MNKTFTAAVCLALVSLTAFSQEKETKKGWSLSALPAVSYSHDLGFQYGAFGHVYNYGDGTIYPKFKQDIGWELSHFTKGRTRAHLSLDTKYLIPGIRFMASATYVNDPLYNFYGFNGMAQDYLTDLAGNADYLNSVSAADKLLYAVRGVNPFAEQVGYNFMRRDMLRVLMDFQGEIVPGFNWAGGLAFWDYMIGDQDAKYGYDTKSTLYNHYVSKGVIRPEEQFGGIRLEAKAGVSYDTRDIEAAPNKGIWAEAYLNASPDLFKDGNPFYMKANLHFRQFLSLPFSWKGGGAVFAYHLAYQGTIAGETPWYMQANINNLILRQMISEGLGSSNTIRGTFTSRMIGEGYAWANTELRVKLVSFKLLGQYFYLAANPFFDFGAIVQPYRLDEMANLPELALKYKATGDDLKSAIRKDACALQHSYGAGLKIGWNQNFIVSVEMGQTGTDGMGYRNFNWINIGTGYSF